MSLPGCATLRWPKVGEVTANNLVDKFPTNTDHNSFIDVLNNDGKLPINASKPILILLR